MISKRRAGAYLGTATALYALGVALTRRERLWTVSHGKRGFALELREVPTWATVLENALAALPCTCSAPEWTWKVGPRRFGVHDDGSGDPVHSLGSLLVELCQQRASISWRAEKHVARVGVTREQAMEVDAHWVAQCDEIFDAEEPNPHATGPDSSTETFICRDKA